MDEAKFLSAILSTFEALAGQCRIRRCHGKGSGWLSVDQYRLQVLQVLVHRVNLLNVLLRCDGFIGIQKAVVDQKGADHQTVTMTFIWCKLDFGKCFGASWSSHWASCRQLSYKIHPSSYITILSRKGSLLLPAIREDDTEKRWFFFFDLWSAHEAPTYWALLPFQLLQIPNDHHRMINFKFLGNISCSFESISFSDLLN